MLDSKDMLDSANSCYIYCRCGLDSISPLIESTDYKLAELPSTQRNEKSSFLISLRLRKSRNTSRDLT